MILKTLEENIPLVSSEDDNVDTASRVPADTENEHSSRSPPSPTVDCPCNPPSPATSPGPQRSRRMPTRFRYYAPGDPIYCQFLQSHLLHSSYYHHLSHPGCMDFQHKCQLRHHLSTMFHIYGKHTFHLFFSIIFMLRTLG